jgi:uncharacterized cupredoxin-like copper-binding protein
MNVLITMKDLSSPISGIIIELKPILPDSTWTTNFTFRTAGRYEIACQMGRHYQASMRLPIAVES